MKERPPIFELLYLYRSVNNLFITNFRIFGAKIINLFSITLIKDKSQRNKLVTEPNPPIVAPAALASLTYSFPSSDSKPPM